MEFDIISSTDNYMQEKRFVEPIRLRTAHSYWPSEASVVYTDTNNIYRVLGKCLRAAFYNNSGIKHTDLIDPRGMRILAIGKDIEQLEIEWIKEAGLWWGNNVKFHHKFMNIIISGEVDCFIKRPDGIIEGLEYKTGYGYLFETEQFGTVRKFGYPKDDHLLQVILYLDHFSKISNFSIIYVNRGDMTRAEHRISLRKIDREYAGQTIEDKEAIVTSMAKNKSNTLVEGRFTVRDIYDRYIELDNKLNEHIVPKRDYFINWPEDIIEREYDLGNISKGKYTKWKTKKIPISDWRCRYCQFAQICKTAPMVEYPESEIPSEYQPHNMKVKYVNR